MSVMEFLTGNPQTGKELAEKMGLPDKRLVQIEIERARNEGAPICSNEDGYYVSHDPAELRECYRRLRRRYIKQAINARVLLKTARRHERHQELTLPW